jgi:hypothetical protein
METKSKRGPGRPFGSRDSKPRVVGGSELRAALKHERLDIVKAVEAARDYIGEKTACGRSLIDGWLEQLECGDPDLEERARLWLCNRYLGLAPRNITIDGSVEHRLTLELLVAGSRRIEDQKPEPIPADFTVQQPVQQPAP